MSTLKIIALCILFSGCTSVERLGAESRFQSMLGTKTLTRDGLVCSRDPRAGMSIQNQIVWQDKNDKCYIGDTVASLKQGDSVVVTDVVEVKRSNLFKFQHWYIVGHLLNQAEPISFIYHWGMSTTSPDYPDNINVPEWE